MSAWQRWQASDCMKYLPGILPPSLVCAELGKNLPCGPSPSPSMEAGGIKGVGMRLWFLQVTARDHHAPAAMAAVTTTSAANRGTCCPGPVPSHTRDASHEAARNTAPVTHRAMCA